MQLVIFTGMEIGASPRAVDGHSTVDQLQQHVVEEVRLSKATMRWVRDDRSPVSVFPWFLLDRLGIGDPPSRVERATADKVVAMTAGCVRIRPSH